MVSQIPAAFKTVGTVAWPRAYRFEGVRGEVQLLSKDTYNPSTQGELAVVSNPEWGELGLVGASGDVELRLLLPEGAKVHQFVSTSDHRLFVLHSSDDSQTLSCFSQVDGRPLGETRLEGERTQGGAAWTRSLLSHRGEPYLLSKHGLEKLNSDLSPGQLWKIPVDAERVQSQGEDLLIYEREQGVSVLRDGTLHSHSAGKPVSDGAGRYWLVDGSKAQLWDPSSDQTRTFEFPDLEEKGLKLEAVFPRENGFAVLTDRETFGNHEIRFLDPEGKVQDRLEIPQGQVHQAYLRPDFKTMVFEHSSDRGEPDGIIEVDLGSSSQQRWKYVARGSVRGMGMDRQGNVYLRHGATGKLEVFDPKLKVSRESDASPELNDIDWVHSLRPEYVGTFEGYLDRTSSPLLQRPCTARPPTTGVGELEPKMVEQMLFDPKLMTHDLQRDRRDLVFSRGEQWARIFLETDQEPLIRMTETTKGEPVYVVAQEDGTTLWWEPTQDRCLSFELGEKPTGIEVSFTAEKEPKIVVQGATSDLYLEPGVQLRNRWTPSDPNQGIEIEIDDDWLMIGDHAIPCDF